jgi:polysaccharide pyruvyl transferase WcaK-like protein
MYAASHEQYLKPVVDFIATLSDLYRMPAVIVPIAMNAADSDVASGYKLSSMYPGIGLRVLDEPTLTPALVKGILAFAYAAVGVSYHFCTFALSQGVPAICLFDGAYYGQKAKGLSAFWADERLTLPMKDLNSPEAIERARGLIEDQEFRQALRAEGSEAMQRWETLFDRKVHTILLGQKSST